MIKILSKSKKIFIELKYNKSISKIFHNILHIDDSSCPYYKIANNSPYQIIKNLNIKTFQQKTQQIQVSTLSNGITVISQSASIPSNVHMGILFDVGTRDQTPQQSGSLLSMKTTYYKSIVKTNQTINYGMIQMAGGKFNMDYTRQNTFYYAHCLPHDVVDIFSMVVDCALQPRNLLAAQVGKFKCQSFHKFDSVNGNIRKLNDSLFSTAYGINTLGMPLIGLHSNIENLDFRVIQKFQIRNYNPSNIFVLGAGIQSHKEFHQLAQQFLSGFAFSSQKQARQKSKYIGGQIRNYSDSSLTDIIFAFQGQSWNGNYLPLYIAKQLINSSEKHKGYAYQQIHKNFYLEKLDSFNYAFTDSGLFGVHINGSSTHVILFNRAKNYCKVQYNYSIEPQNVLLNKYKRQREG